MEACDSESNWTCTYITCMLQRFSAVACLNAVFCCKCVLSCICMCLTLQAEKVKVSCDLIDRWLNLEACQTTEQ